MLLECQGGLIHATLHIVNADMDQFISSESFHIREVQFFFRSKHTGVEHTYAIVSMWSEPDPQLLKESSQAVLQVFTMGRTHYKRSKPSQ